MVSTVMTTHVTGLYFLVLFVVYCLFALCLKMNVLNIYNIIPSSLMKFTLRISDDSDKCLPENNNNNNKKINSVDI